MESYQEKFESFRPGCTSKALHTDSCEEADEALLQLFDSDSDEGSFGNLALDLYSEHTTEKPVKNSVFKQSGFSKLPDSFKENIQKPRKLERSLSAEAKPEETICKNCLNNPIDGYNPNIYLMLNTQLATVLDKLKLKTEECEALININLELNRLLEPVASRSQNSLFKRIWSYPAVKKVAKVAVPESDRGFFKDKTLIIKTPNPKIIDYEMQVQEKDKEITKLQENIITQEQYLKQNFHKRTEIQKQILEETDLRCQTMEEKLDVERKLRETRETEISHMQNYINKKEKYYKNDIDVRMSEIKVAHSQEIKILNKIIKQKDEELSQASQTYNLLLGRCNQEIAAVNGDFRIDDVFKLEEIKIGNLERSLQLKTKQLNEAYVEINKLQRELNNKNQELGYVLSKLYKREEQNVIKHQLQNIRQQISDILDGFEAKSSLPAQLSVSEDSKGRNVVSHEIRKEVGDKEEVSFEIIPVSEAEIAIIR